MNKETRILLTGGGTGGHIYPLSAVAKKIQEQTPNADIAYAGQPGGYRGILEQHNIKILSVVSSKWRRYFSPLNVLEVFRFFIGFLQAFWKIYWFMPDALFSKGGPGALPIILVCRFYLIPIVIHESDVIPGLTSIISARYAKKIFLAFEEAEGYFQNKNTEVVGQPVRDEIASGGLPPSETRKMLGFSADLPMILVIGGSQGSTRINDFILSNLKLLLEKFQILHQIGENNYKDYNQEYEVESRRLSPLLKSRYHFAAYLNNSHPFTMASALSAADAVISRGGASAIFEISALGKPSILIPLPESARNHQEANAYAFQKTGAAIVIEEENLKPNLFESILENLFSASGGGKNLQKLQMMSEAAKRFYKPQAAEKIASYILKLLNENKYGH